MITIEVSDSKAITQLPAFQIQVSSNATTPPPAANAAPTIAGTPATTATVGQTYTFAPVGDDANNDTLTYTIQNKPTLADVHAARPAESPARRPRADVGTHQRIVITVSDGQATRAAAVHVQSAGRRADAAGQPRPDHHRNPGDQRSPRAAPTPSAGRQRSGRQHADLFDPEQAELGDIQRHHRSPVGHPDRRRTSARRLASRLP